MPLCYADQHMKCNHYTTTDTAIVKYQNFEHLRNPRIVIPNHSTIVMVLSGGAIVDCDTILNIHVKAGDIYLIPSGSEMRMYVPEAIEFISVVFAGKVTLCNKFSLKELIKVDRVIEDGVFNMLPIRDRLATFCELAKDTLVDGLGCIHYHKMLVNQLFIYLRAYYTEEELYNFFYPILSRDLDFKDLILSKFREVDSVAGLAELANMSVSSFNKKFKEEFNGATASEWLAKRKAELLYMDLTVSDLSLVEIADKHHFSTQAYMSTFCKKHFNDTPQSIRTNFQDVGSPIRFKQNCVIEQKRKTETE